MIFYLVAGITALILVVLLVAIINVEIRNYLLFRIKPQVARNITFVKLQNDNQFVYILGTIHGAHLATKNYSLWHVEAVINNVHPDLVLVESRPEELAQDNWADGPVEMLFSSLTAKELGIPVDGMDWWTMDNAGRSNTLREDKMYQHIVSRISGRRRILIIAGFSHVPEFTQRFRDSGFSLADFPTVEKEKLFTIIDKERLYPAGMVLYLEKRIELDKKAHADARNPKIRSAFKNSVEFRSHLLQDIKAQGERQ